MATSTRCAHMFVWRTDDPVTEPSELVIEGDATVTLEDDGAITIADSHSTLTVAAGHWRRVRVTPCAEQHAKPDPLKPLDPRDPRARRIGSKKFLQNGNRISRWSDEDILGFVHQFVEFATEHDVNPRLWQYDAWRREHCPLAPSSSMVLRRCVAMELLNWTQIINKVIADRAEHADRDKDSPQ